MRKVQLVFILLFINIIFSSCNSYEDVERRSPEDMLNYVQDAIDEDISLIGMEENRNVITYKFKLDERDVIFEVDAYIEALIFEDIQFTNYSENIMMSYEQDIMGSQYYIDERTRIAKKLDIDEEVWDFDDYECDINIGNYDDLERLAKYIVELDELYAFKEKDPSEIRHINVGSISYNDIGDKIAGPLFSWNSKHRLKYKKIYKEILESLPDDKCIWK